MEDTVEETLGTNEGVGAPELEGVGVDIREGVPKRLRLALEEGLGESERGGVVDIAGVPLPTPALPEGRVVGMGVGEGTALVLALPSPERVAAAEGLSKEGLESKDTTPELL